MQVWGRGNVTTQQSQGQSSNSSYGKVSCYMGIRVWVRIWMRGWGKEIPDQVTGDYACGTDGAPQLIVKLRIRFCEEDAHFPELSNRPIKLLKLTLSARALAFQNKHPSNLIDFAATRYEAWKESFGRGEELAGSCWIPRLERRWLKRWKFFKIRRVYFWDLKNSQ